MTVTTDPVARVKRGRGRPRKVESVVHWSAIEKGAPVEIVGKKGTYFYRLITDNGYTVVVYDPVQDKLRPFFVDRVVVLRTTPRMDPTD